MNPVAFRAMMLYLILEPVGLLCCLITLTPLAVAVPVLASALNWRTCKVAKARFVFTPWRIMLDGLILSLAGAAVIVASSAPRVLDATQGTVRQVHWMWVAAAATGGIVAVERVGALFVLWLANRLRFPSRDNARG